MAKSSYANVAPVHTSIPLKIGSSNTFSISAGQAGSGGSGNQTYAIPNGNWSTTEVKSNAIHVNGDAVFRGNITWQDRDMREWFESVEARLSILQPNPELEAEWSELAELRMKYVELERKLLEKQRVFDILKKDST